MSPNLRGVLQLDFDGTLAEGDVSTGILAHFTSPDWEARIEAASQALVADANSPALIDAMVAGYAALGMDVREECLRYAREHHPARAGLPELVDTARRIGLECHVVSNGFEFYIQDYLLQAGVHERVVVHTGSEGVDGKLVYLGPDGQPTRSRFKQRWTEHFLGLHDLLVYVGDGSSDVAPAQQASIVFARDSLLARMPAGYAGTLRSHETLHDVARELKALLS